MKKLDNIDSQIITILQADSNVNIKAVAKQLNLTVTPVYERIKKLEKAGVIEKYVAKVNPYKLGLDLLVFTHVSLKEHTKAFLVNFEKEVVSINEVIECHHVTGEHDYLLKVMVKNMDSYRHFLTDKLARIKNIGNVHSSFVVNEIKKSGIYQPESM
ncbi:MAG: Lrp/AsnC family transcriptional regulator [Crocinitomicaceae bacterium]